MKKLFKIKTLLTLSILLLASMSGMSQIVLTSGVTGTTTPVGQSFNETRCVDVNVLPPNCSITLTAITLNQFDVGADETAIVGARIYNATTNSLLYSSTTTVNNIHNGTVSIPISYFLNSGTTYRIGFFCGGTLSDNSAIMFQPNSFPYTESLGLLQILNARSGVGDVFPVNTNIYVPFITLNYTVNPCPPADPYSNTYWTWMKGDSTSNVAGVYGTKGVAAATNKPGARDGSVSWTDSSGNFWLFGGSEFNDLWKYNTLTNEWTWVKGDSTPYVLGIYGTLGVAADTNKPGARYGSVSWTDSTGNLWLFGGAGYYPVLGFTVWFNDLWKYHISSNQWTWVKGDSSISINVHGQYGIKGTADAANKPGARIYDISWKDVSGNFWLFGGIGYPASGSNGTMNDLWKYNPTANQWTWVKGDSTINIHGIYGTQGTAYTANKPGARSLSSSWTDVSGNFWLFGGNGYPASGSSGSINDLWKYNISTNQWTWVKGDSIYDVQGVYGTKGVSAAANKPGARFGSVSWTDGKGNLWLFGGLWGLGESDLNDLWKYDTTSNQWTWVKGSNAGNEIGVYGTKGIEAPGNTPGGREGSVSWNDRFGNLWIFGGYSYSQSEYYNDLWKIYGGSTYIFTGNGDWDNAGNWLNSLIGPKNIPGGVSVIIDNIPSGQCDAR